MLKKALVSAIMIVFLAVGMVGCGGGATAKEKNNESQPAPAQSAGTAAPDNKEQQGQKSNQETNKPAAPAQAGPAGEEVKRDSGRYVGQIDNNFIEIKISGVPDSLAAKSFMLSEKVKAEFGKYGLKKDDEVMFGYYVNNHNQNIILEIKKIGPAK